MNQGERQVPPQLCPQSAISRNRMAKAPIFAGSMMPNLVRYPQEAADVISYILSLREQHSGV